MPRFTAKVWADGVIPYDAEVTANNSIDARKIIARREGVDYMKVNPAERVSEVEHTSSSDSSSGGDSGAYAIVFLTFIIVKLWALLHFLPWVGLFGGGIFAWKKTNELTEDKMSGTKRFFLLFFVTTLASTACYQGSVKVQEYIGYSPSGVQEALVESFSD